MANPMQDILDDATLVADFGQRAGVLRDSTLFEAIGEATNASPLNRSSSVALKLQTALNGAVQAIHPVTLVDLREGWNPFSRNSGAAGQKRGWGRSFVLSLSIAVMLLCAHYTIWEKRASLVLADVSAAKEDKQALVMNELLPLIADIEGAVEEAGLDDPVSLSSVAFRQKIGEVRDLEQLMLGDSKRYFGLLDTYYPLTPRAAQALAWTKEKWANWQLGSQDASAAEASPTDRGNPPPALASCTGVPVKQADEVVSAATTVDAVKQADIFEGQVTRIDIAQAQLRCILGLNAMGARGSQQYIVDTENMKNKLEVLNSWMLPALYGMLGALIFHVRAYMAQLRPDPTLSKVTLRVFLGGFAGVAIGWFWSPEATEGLGVAEISLATLTVAFLVGFAIDVFFALLDRLVTIMQGGIQRLGVQS